MKNLTLIVLIIFIISSIIVFDSSCNEEFNIEESENIARTFLEESATYQFSGIQGTIKLVESEKIASPNKWEFAYEFLSGSSGYGDRIGMDINQETKIYEAKITVWEYKVVRAVINEHWDELSLNFTHEPI